MALRTTVVFVYIQSRWVATSSTTTLFSMSLATWLFSLVLTKQYYKNTSVSGWQDLITASPSTSPTASPSASPSMITKAGKNNKKAKSSPKPTHAPISPAPTISVAPVKAKAAKKESKNIANLFNWVCGPMKIKKIVVGCRDFVVVCRPPTWWCLVIWVCGDPWKLRRL